MGYSHQLNPSNLFPFRSASQVKFSIMISNNGFKSKDGITIFVKYD